MPAALPDVTTLNAAALLTTAGAGAFGIVLSFLVQVIKDSFPSVDARVSGALISLIISAFVYILVFISGAVTKDSNGILLTLFSWVTAWIGAMGTNAIVTHVTSGSKAKAAPTGKAP